jgi:hypothetical protein
MTRLIDFTLTESTPHLAGLLAREVQGMGAVPDRLVQLFTSALAIFERDAAPKGVLREVTAAEFALIYPGEGLNEPEAPLDLIIPRAQRLALFAATVGDTVSEEVGALFRRGEPALGYALDVIASEATVLLADTLATQFLQTLRARRAVPAEARALPYSPGYCGWHISGQRRLFEALHAGTIDIRLSGSFLMRPLKSVSGVIVVGPPAAHRFQPTFPFCDDCTTRECRPRMVRAAATPS